MALPLQGLRALDLGTRIAAPFCAGLLGEQGAEVIKVEQPGTGDFMREIGPLTEEGYSLFWAVEGRGRKSVTLDLRQPEGQRVFRSLAGTADVIVENFRPGTLERWNIAPRDLDPRLVSVRISTFGQDGPLASRPGLDRVGIGYGGLLNLTVIVANGARMPVEAALAGDLLRRGPIGQYVLMGAGTQLNPLADWISIPSTSEVYSPGDLVIAAGLALVAFLVARRKPAPGPIRPRRAVS